MSETREKLWTLKELAESGEPKKSIKTWRRMIQEGKIHAVRVGSGRGMLYVADSELSRLGKDVQAVCVSDSTIGL